jgi:hypothetical protein
MGYHAFQGHLRYCPVQEWLLPSVHTVSRPVLKALSGLDKKEVDTEGSLDVP